VAITDEFGASTQQNILSGGDGAKSYDWNLLNGASADAIDVNSTNAGQLTINHNTVNSDAYNGTFNAPFVFKNISGDFDIEIYGGDSNCDYSYEGFNLIARDPSASAGEDHVRICSYNASGTITLFTGNTANSSTSIGVNDISIHDKYLRMTRVGNVFTLYSKATSGASWTQRSQWTRNDFGTSVQVGLAATTANTGGALNARFDYFRSNLSEGSSYDVASAFAASSGFADSGALIAATSSPFVSSASQVETSLLAVTAAITAAAAAQINTADSLNRSGGSAVGASAGAAAIAGLGREGSTQLAAPSAISPGASLVRAGGASLGASAATSAASIMTMLASLSLPGGAGLSSGGLLVMAAAAAISAQSTITSDAQLSNQTYDKTAGLTASGGLQTSGAGLIEIAEQLAVQAGQLSGASRSQSAASPLECQAAIAQAFERVFIVASEFGALSGLESDELTALAGNLALGISADIQNLSAQIASTLAGMGMSAAQIEAAGAAFSFAALCSIEAILNGFADTGFGELSDRRLINVLREVRQASVFHEARIQIVPRETRIIKVEFDGN